MNVQLRSQTHARGHMELTGVVVAAVGFCRHGLGLFDERGWLFMPCSSNENIFAFRNFQVEGHGLF
jgi:hypothetical protein